jgi:ubiquinone/menaquinone biosynthesis C-methylase UbiE
MKKILKIEKVSGRRAKLYSLLAQKSPIAKDLYREVANEVYKKISSGRILDVGTGPGYLPVEIAKKSKRLKIIGVDISSDMIKIARKNLKRAGLSKQIKFKISNAENLPFKDEYFNFIVSTASFHHWSNPIKCINEIYRVLKKDKEVWIYDVRRDTTKGVNTEFRKKYGLVLSFLFLTVVRSHSSVSLSKVKKIISFPKVKFQKKQVEDRGVMFRILLMK